MGQTSAGGTQRVAAQRKRPSRMVIAGGVAAGLVVMAGLGWMFFANRKNDAPRTEIATATPVSARPLETASPPMTQPVTDSSPVLAGPSKKQAGPAVVAQRAMPPVRSPAAMPAVARPLPAPPLTAGGLTVRSQPGSSVLIDGSPAGTTGSEGVLLVPHLQAGRHLLSIRREGFRQEERTINFGGQSDVV